MGVDFVHVNGAQERSGCRRRWAAASPSSTTTATAGPTCSSSPAAYWPGDPRAEEPEVLARALPQRRRRRRTACRTFENVTREAGLEKVFYGMGAAVGDYDNDGRDRRLRHGARRQPPLPQSRRPLRGSREEGGLADSGWGTSAAWLDFDGDGLLDLFVGRYVDWTPEKDLYCTLDGKTKSYCTPERYPGNAVAPLPQPRRRTVRGRHEEGGRRNARTRRPSASRPGISTATAEIDILVANDTAPNNLFRQPRRRHVRGRRDRGGRRGRRGRTRARRDGRAWADTKNGKRLGAGDRQLLQRAEVRSTGPTRARSSSTSPRRAASDRASLLALTFGVLFFDADLDGALDLLLANGHVEPTVQEVQKDVAYRQAADPLPQRRRRTVRPRSASFGRPREASRRARGGVRRSRRRRRSGRRPRRERRPGARLPEPDQRAAEVGPPAPRRHGRSNRDAVGARVTRDDRRPDLCRSRSRADSTYLSASEKTLTFGLGDAAEDRHPRDPLAGRRDADAEGSAGRGSSNHRRGRSAMMRRVVLAAGLVLAAVGLVAGRRPRPARVRRGPALREEVHLCRRARAHVPARTSRRRFPATSRRPSSSSFTAGAVRRRRPSA